LSDIRGTGLHQVIELVKSRKTCEPMSHFNQPLSEPMRAVATSLRAQGLSTFVRWNWIFCTPPLVINDEQITEGLSMIDQALEKANEYCES